MPKTVTQVLQNPRVNGAGITYYQDYSSRLKADSDLKDQLWEQWDSFESGEFLIWFRPSGKETRVETALKMPSDIGNISGLYRVECYIPNMNAGAIARYSIMLPGNDGRLLEKNFYINQKFYKSTWVALGDFYLTAGDPNRVPDMGTVRQFDENAPSSIPGAAPAGSLPLMSFGPVRWVPLYQTPDPIYATVDSEQFSITYPDPQPAQPESFWRMSPKGSVEQPPVGRQIVWGPARWLQPSSAPAAGPVRIDYDILGSAWERKQSTNQSGQIPVELPIPAPISGRYRVEALIPFFDRQRLNPAARYSVRWGPDAANLHETIVNQTLPRLNQWVSLGEFSLTFPTAADTDPAPIGRVTLREARSKTALTAVGPVRWVPLFEMPFTAGGAFDFPVGSFAQRKAAIIRRSKPSAANPTGQSLDFWLEDWFDATPFLTEYILGLHTGADLNFARGSGLHLPVYAAGDGKIIYAKKVERGGWNYLIVIEHPAAFITLEGRRIQRKVYTRYGHVHKDSINILKPFVGQEVKCGDLIGYVGYMCQNDIAEKTDGEHLHFDVCYTDRLAKNPEYWPNMKTLVSFISSRTTHLPDYPQVRDETIALVCTDFLDPFQFIIDNHTPTPGSNSPAAAENGLLNSAAVRYDLPVGSPEQRSAQINLRLEQMRAGIFSQGAEDWYISTDFLAQSPNGQPLPGVNFRLPNSEAGPKPVCAAGPGKVIFAGRKSLGPYASLQMVVVRHPQGVVSRSPGTGAEQVIYTRYAGLSSILVKGGDLVQTGDQLGTIGAQQTVSPGDWWLHFSVSDSSVLEQPDHWPAKDTLEAAKAKIRQDYLHPLQFLINNHPSAPQLQGWR